MVTITSMCTASVFFPPVTFPLQRTAVDFAPFPTFRQNDSSSSMIIPYYSEVENAHICELHLFSQRVSLERDKFAILCYINCVR